MSEPLKKIRPVLKWTKEGEEDTWKAAAGAFSLYTYRRAGVIRAGACNLSAGEGFTTIEEAQVEAERFARSELRGALSALEVHKSEAKAAGEKKIRQKKAAVSAQEPPEEVQDKKPGRGRKAQEPPPVAEGEKPKKSRGRSKAKKAAEEAPGFQV